ncbi:MAG: ECF transporter S component [Defluviitaleaceae bacterium]|nr:ECF transporter S component [Defluviitaleaceae bacterium]
MKNNVKQMVLSAMFVALVYLATAFVRVPSPFATGTGQIHTGTAVVFVVSIAFGPKMGAISSIGMVLFNLTHGLALWAPINLIVRPLMAVIFGSVARLKGADGRNVFLNAAAGILGGLWLLPGMYLGELLVFQVPLSAPAVGILGNSLQIALALIFGLPLIAVLNLHKAKL